jgi:hypothetical protein
MKKKLPLPLPLALLSTSAPGQVTAQPFTSDKRQRYAAKGRSWFDFEIAK